MVAFRSGWLRTMSSSAFGILLPIKGIVAGVVVEGTFSVGIGLFPKDDCGMMSLAEIGCAAAVIQILDHALCGSI